MKRFALIGNPVAGSLSPRLFEAAYGGRYAYDLLEGPSFGELWQRFLDGYDGINITAPFKQDAFRCVGHLTEEARLCGAVNLAVKTESGIVGCNTDVDGVVLSVRETGIPVSDALVVGCGGAGRAAAVAALRLGCRVTLANRTASRAEELSAALGCGWVPVEALSGLSPDLHAGAHRARPGLHFRPPLAAVPGGCGKCGFHRRKAGCGSDVPDFLLTLRKYTCIMALNKVMLIGNVGNDPEIRYLDSNPQGPQGNAKVASFRLATTERFRDRSGETRENTEWHNIVAWRSTADLVERFVHRGSQIYVEGRLRTRQWTDQSGNKRYTTEIQADNIQLLGRRPDREGDGGQPGGYNGGQNGYSGPGYNNGQGGYSGPGYGAQPQAGYQQPAPQAQPSFRSQAPSQPAYPPQPQPAAPAPVQPASDSPDDDLPF